MPPFTFIIDRPSLVGEAVMQILLEREYDFDVRRTLTQGLVVTIHSPRYEDIQKIRGMGNVRS